MIKEKKGLKLKYIKKRTNLYFPGHEREKKIKKVDRCQTIHHHRHTLHHE